jgi:signal transduction histidine kinase/putative methionine-R-sulfoxide reductase with GAF domain
VAERGSSSFGTLNVTEPFAKAPQQTVADLQRRLDEAVAQQTATAGVLKVISRSTFDLQTVLETLIKSAVQLCGANRGSIFFREGDVFPLRAASSTTPQFLKFWAANPPKAGRGSATARVIASGKIEVIADVLADPEMEMPANSLKNIRAALGVPMLRDNRVEGVMVLTRPEPGPFSQSQIDLVQTFADQAVIAIENTRLFNETEELLERQTATADILKVIASSPDDVQPVFQAIADRSKQLVNALSTTVFKLVDGVMHLQAFTATTPQADAALLEMFPAPLWKFDWGESIRKGEIYRVIDVEQEFDRIREVARMRGWRSMLAVPLLRDGKPIGMIGPTRAEPGPFSDHHVQLLQTFADQAVIAIQNAQMFNETKEALEQQTATSEVLKVISSSFVDAQPVFDAIVKSCSGLFPDAAVAIGLPDEDVIKAVALAENDSVQSSKWRQRFPIPLNREYMHGISILDRRIIDIPDGRDASPEFTIGSSNFLTTGYRAITIVPMLKDNVAIGTLSIVRIAPGPLTDRQMILLKNFAAQAVIAIENARLLNELRQRTEDLSRSLDELRTAKDRLVQTEKLASLGQLTAGIAHEIKNPLNFVNNFSALSAELTDELNSVLKPVAMEGKVRGEVDELTGLLKDNLEKVVQHGKRADSIVKNMLLHSREGSGEHRPTDINSLLDESLNLAYHGARAEKGEFNITLQRDFDPEAGTIELFPQEITRAFLNLIANGVYAASKRKMEDKELAFEPVLRATTKKVGNSVQICIWDNGAGIPTEVQDKIFNPFFTTKPAGEGTGLGLSMAHDIIVKQHSGRIDVATELGQFTQFTIVLPRKIKVSSSDRGER